MNKEKILEQFHYFNINAEIDSVFGNWAVSTEGDVVNCLYPYVIMAFYLQGTDWVKKVRTKIWFKQACEKSLIQALDRARIIVEIK